MGERLDGTVALVTGASSGIGEATARALARAGAKVAIAARRKDRLDALAAEIDALVIEADITDREQAIATVDRTVDELGRLDTVVNNAGVMLLGEADDAPLDDWERMVDINVSGLLYVAHAAIEPLLAAAQDSPRHVADLVNISSIAGRRANRGSAVYNLTKHGVGAFSEALRQEFATRHLRVSLVEPGAVTTELVRADGRGEAGGGAQALRGRRAADRRRHRRRDRVHRHPPVAGRGQRDHDPADRAGVVNARSAGTGSPMPRSS